MEQKDLIFGEDCINKNAFHKNKRPINDDEADIKRIVWSGKHSYGNEGSFTNFIGYRNNCNAFPILWRIKLPQMNEYVKYFHNNNKYMDLLAHDKKLFKQYKEMWDY